MSNSESSPALSRRARASSVILIMTLIVFSTIVIAQSSSLQWPLATDVGKLLTPLKNSNTANSSLLVSATSYLPALDSCPPFPCFTASLNQPIVNADIVVKTFGQNPTVVAKNYTDSQGQRFFEIRPGVYQLYFTSNIVNISTPIVVSSRNTTELDIKVNETLYPCAFIDISNPISPTLIAPWNTIFLNVQSNSSINLNSNESLSLVFLPPNKGPAILPNSTHSAQALGGYYSNTVKTQWLEVKLNSVAVTPTAYAAYLLTYLPSYSTREYLMNMTTTTTTTI